jgi:hypothetical protein
MFVGLSHRGSRRVIPQAAAMVWQPYKHKFKQSFRSSETITRFLNHGFFQ